MDLSVIIPSYRAPRLLQQALRSLADDVAQLTVEVIVVDDGSPDYDANDLAGLSGRWPLTLIHFEQNQGRAAARNEGLRHARGETVVFLDGDMTVGAGFLAAHAAFHRQHPRAIAVGDIRFAPDIRVDAMTRYIHSRGVARCEAGPVPFKCFVTGNSSVPRQALLDTDGFDEAFVTYGGEDLELGYRLHNDGLKVHYLPEAASLHHEVRPFAQMGDAMFAYGRDTVPLILERHPELAQLLRLDFLQKPRWNLRRWALTIALWSPVLAFVHGVVVLLMRWRLPGILFDYLWWCRRTRGFMSRSASEAR